MPRPLQFGQAPSEFALNSAGLTPFAFANAVRIGSRMPVYVAGLERREPRIADWSMTVTDGSVRGRQPWISELLPEPATPGHRDEHAERHVDRDVLEVVEPRVPDRDRAARRSRLRLQLLADVEVAAGGRPRRDQAVDRALVHDGPAVGPGARAHVDDVVGDPDHLRVVLDDEDRVALVAQAPEQRVHPLDVVGVQPDGRLVEDVGDVGQRRPEVADHPRALRLAARERAGRPVEAEVAEAHLDERVEALAAAPPSSGADRRLVQAAHPLGQVADLHRAGVGDADARRSSTTGPPR